MPLINFRNVLSCSSEDRIHCAENLLKPEQYKKWLSAKGGEERITCIVEFEKSSFISSIDIGNDGSAFIELLVSRSSSSKADDWTALLPPTLLMTPNESRSNKNRNQVKLLKTTDLNKTCLNEKWDRLKIICEQKFNRLDPFGLCFIKLHSPSSESDETAQTVTKINSSLLDKIIDNEDDDETGKEQSRIGLFFAKKQAERHVISNEISSTNEIRTLSNVADELLSKKSMNDREIQTLLKKEAPKTPSRISKRRLSNQSEPSPVHAEVKRNKKMDKSQIMKKVAFVLSGFQNPLRSELRTKAVEMGATYKDDWDEACTHLICAFPNTPKFTQVKRSRNGLIVDKNWILDCYEQSQLLPEKNYQLKETSSSTVKKDTPSRSSEKKQTNKILNNSANENVLISKDIQKKSPLKSKPSTFDDDNDRDTRDEESKVLKAVQDTKQSKKKIKTFDDDDDDDDDDYEHTVASKSVTKKPCTINEGDNVYNADTDEDETEIENKSYLLTNCFQGKHFYVFDDEFNESTYRDIRRIIYAYDGILEKRISSNVKYVITNRTWNQDFEKIAKQNPEIKFLTLNWLQSCHNENKCVPHQSFLIKP